MAIGLAVVHSARVAHAFIAGIKSRHCLRVFVFVCLLTVPLRFQIIADTILQKINRTKNEIKYEPGFNIITQKCLPKEIYTMHLH